MCVFVCVVVCVCVFVCVGKGGRMLFILPRVHFNSQTSNNRPVARNSNCVVLLYRIVDLFNKILDLFNKIVYF